MEFYSLKNSQIAELDAGALWEAISLALSDKLRRKFPGKWEDYLQEIRSIFENQGIDGESFLKLTKEELKEMKIESKGLIDALMSLVSVSSEEIDDKVVLSESKLDVLDIQMALAASLASYEEDPFEYLKDNCHTHYFERISYSRNKHHQYVLCFTNTNFKYPDVLYVSFRGTVSDADMKDDLMMLPTVGFDGKVHSGFKKRANAIPLRFFISLLREKKIKRIVFCGHSLGGAIAHMVALQLLESSSSHGIQKESITSIAFGAPFFGNEDVAEYVRKMFPDRIYTIANDKDVIPSILNIGSTMSVLAKQTGKVLDQAEPLLRLVSSFYAPVKMVSEMAKRGGDYLRDLKLDSALTPIYHPIGSYGFMQYKPNRAVIWESDDDEISKRLAKSTNLDPNQLQFHRLDKYKTFLAQILGLKDEYPPHLFFDKDEYREPKSYNELTPKLTTAFCLIQRNPIDSKREFTMTLTGWHLDFFSSLETSGARIKGKLESKRCDRLIYSGEYVGEIFGNHPMVIVHTHFGSVHTKLEIESCVPVDISVRARGQLDPEFFYKLYEIAYAKYKMENADNISNLLAQPILKELIQLERILFGVEKIPAMIKATKNLEAITKAKTLQQRLVEIFTALCSSLSIEEEKRTTHYLLIGTAAVLAIGGIVATGGAAAVAYGIINSAMLASVTAQVAAGGFGVSAFFGGIGLSTIQEVKKKCLDDYTDIAEFLLDELNVPGKQSALYGREIFVLEEVIGQKSKSLKFDRPLPEILESDKNFIPGGSLGKSTKKSKEDAVKRILAINQVHQLREMLINNPFVGIVGEQDSGKTTLIQTLGMPVPKDQIGFDAHTSQLHFYPWGGVTVADFPGSDSVDKRLVDIMNDGGFVSSLFIIVTMFRGDPNINILNSVSTIKEMFRCPVLLCLNQASRFISDALPTEEAALSYRKKYAVEIQQFDKKLNLSEYQKTTEYDIFVSDFKVKTEKPYIQTQKDVCLWIHRKLKMLGYGNYLLDEMEKHLEKF